jgi:hypothetical protein
MKKKSKRAKARTVATYQMGIQNVDLVIDAKLASSRVDLWPRVGNVRMIIGARQGSWVLTLEGLLHETFELAAIQSLRRFTPDPGWAKTLSDYLFVMDHAQFQEIAARCAPFLAGAIPALREAFEARSQ